ncbi:hypothetical protein [Maribacter sp. R86514]|uniref:hypothetical protein n=1 Tax=Maribacter sp. R86514 TaxID=3093854 RepID=UPI0037C91B1A
MEALKRHSIYFINDLNGYKIIGSGILVRIKNLYLILTAAHVLDKFDELFVLIENGSYKFKPGGQLISNEIVTSREEDGIDIGIIKLDEESKAELEKSYSFLDEKHILINQEISKDQDYFIYGFPSSMSKEKYKLNEFHVRPFFNLANPVDKSEYESLDRKHYLNIILTYDKQSTLNAKTKSLSNGPELYGISGCGLWNLYDYEDVKLIAIMTDWPIKNRKRIIGTRADIVTETLRKLFNLNLEESKLFGLK